MRPTLLLRILAPCSLAAVLAVMVAVSVARRRFKGFDAFLIPLIPSFGWIALYLPLLFIGDDTPLRPVLLELGKALRLTMGLSWVLFCRVHYRLCLVGRGGLKGVPVAVAVTILNLAFYLAALVYPGLARYQAPTASFIVSATLFYAGFSAFMILRFTKLLEVSTWTGLVIAGISLVYHPLVALADFFNVGYYSFSHEYPAAMQVHPFYGLFLSAAIALGLLAALKRERRAAPERPPFGISALSSREREILELLLAGHAQKDMAEKLFLSLSTVKGHLSNIYAKLGVSGKNEALALLKKDRG